MACATLRELYHSGLLPSATGPVTVGFLVACGLLVYLYGRVVAEPRWSRGTGAVMAAGGVTVGLFVAIAWFLLATVVCRVGANGASGPALLVAASTREGLKRRR